MYIYIYYIIFKRKHTFIYYNVYIFEHLITRKCKCIVYISVIYGKCARVCCIQQGMCMFGTMGHNCAHLLIQT